MVNLLKAAYIIEGPLGNPNVTRIKLDVTFDEEVICQPDLRTIDHPYPDVLPSPATVLCYSFAEVFAEKIRAMRERALPRDLYDIVTLFRRQDILPPPEVVRSVYERKCESKGLGVLTIDGLLSSNSREELENRWRGMLNHQLPDLPPFSEYWEDLPRLFIWLNS